MSRILIVEDRDSLRNMLVEFLRDHHVLAAASAEDAEPLLIHYPEIVLCDYKLPGMDGITFIRKYKEALPDTVFLVMTAFGDIATAVKAMQAGAYDFLPKPLDLDHLKHTLRRVQEVVQLRRNRDDRSDPVMIFADPAFLTVVQQAEKLAGTDCPILLEGASGTGKEVLARWIHAHSNRKAGPFRAVNCAAVPDDLLASELFGHEAGAFTGASALRKGLFESTDDGTLFLDEIGATSPDFQSGILRVVENGEFYRLGGSTPMTSRARLILASNRDLAAAARTGAFREDLLHRIQGFTLRLPPLRNRPADIPLLATHFAETLGRQLTGKPFPLSETAVQYLAAQPWPGNIRQLRNTIERWIILGQTEIDAPQQAPLSTDTDTDAVTIPISGRRYPDIVAELDRRLLGELLKRHGGNRMAVSRELGLNYKTLLAKLRKLGLDS